MQDVHEIGKNCFLIKIRGELARNVYIKRFGTGAESINMIFDPGGKTDLPVVVKSLKELIGGVEKLHIIFVNHQDPDVASNVGTLHGMAPHAFVISSIDTYRLIRFYGIEEKRFRAIEQFPSNIITLKKTGQRLQFVPSYYCHFRGAVMCYDYESGILFSGDFLGGISTRKDDDVYANEESWEGISIFHQIYMPSREAIRQTVDRITMLPSMPSIIAPQHGDIIKDKMVVEFLTRLTELRVGVELTREAGAAKETFLIALNEILDTMSVAVPSLHKKMMEEMKRPRDFTTLYALSGDSVTDIKISPSDAIMFMKNVIDREADDTDKRHAFGVISKTLKNYDLLELEGVPEELMEREEDSGRMDIF